MIRFSEELAEVDSVFQSAMDGLEDVLDDEDVSAEEDNLAGLELVEDTSTRGPSGMDLDGDDMLAQMEARLAQLSSRVSDL
jgi:hypothetical protein